MTKATVNLTGIGAVEVSTTSNEIVLVGAIAADGSFVNCKAKRVSRSKKSAIEASRNAEHYLKKVGENHFYLV